MMDIWDKVCGQIERDVNDPLNDMTALYEMLQSVPKDVLIAYLPESELDNE
jgi:hypothetical protein